MKNRIHVNKSVTANHTLEVETSSNKLKNKKYLKVNTTYDGTLDTKRNYIRRKAFVLLIGILWYKNITKKIKKTCY